jgi:hypothetical protein
MPHAAIVVALGTVTIKLFQIHGNLQQDWFMPYLVPEENANESIPGTLYLTHFALISECLVVCQFSSATLSERPEQAK